MILATMLDRLNLKLTASNVQAWIIDAYQTKMTEIKQAFASKMVASYLIKCIFNKMLYNKML